MTLILSGTNGVTSVNGTAAAPSVTGTDTDTGIVYGTNTVTIATNGTAGLIQDAGQHIGLNVTPNSNWPSSFSVLETRGGNNLWGVQGQVQVGYNNYYDGTNYRFNGTGNKAERLILTDSGFYFDASATGTAGNVVTFETQLQISYQGTLALRGASPVTGTGISFPATQSASTDANTLDDYEEGSWTPSSGTANVTVTSVSYAKYVKVGRHVHVYTYMQITNNAGAGASWFCAGLPFTCESYGPAFRYYGTNSFSSNCYVESGSTSINDQNGLASGAGIGVMLCASYFTAS